MPTGLQAFLPQGTSLRVVGTLHPDRIHCRDQTDDFSIVPFSVIRIELLTATALIG